MKTAGVTGRGAEVGIARVLGVGGAPAIRLLRAARRPWVRSTPSTTSTPSGGLDTAAGAPIPQALMRAVVHRAVRRQLRTSITVERRRRNIELLATMQRLPPGARIRSTRLSAVPAEHVELPGLYSRRVLLYLHGGGYTIGSPRTHRALVAHLAAAAGRPAFTLDYRLAPEHPFPAAVDDAEAAYRALLRLGFGTTDIAVAGDSAGGGLAVALALRLRDRGVPLPACLALISPWTDLTLSDPSTHSDRREVLLRTAWLEQSSADYADPDRSRPEVSPVFADLRGLPPVMVHVGTQELLRSDADRLAVQLTHDGVPVEVRHLDGMWHVWHLHAGLVAAPTRAVGELGAFIRGAAPSAKQP